MRLFSPDIIILSSSTPFFVSDLWAKLWKLLEMSEAEAGGQYAGLFDIVFVSDSFLSASTTSHPRSEPIIKY